MAAAIIFYTAAFCLLTALAVYDYRHYILPDKLNAGLALVFLLCHFSTQWSVVRMEDAFLGAVAGGGLLLLIRTAANHFYNEDALGLGDVKLMAAAGLGLGFPDVMLALSIGAALGLVHGCIMGWQQKKSGKKINFEKINVPAGPGLCIGIALVMMSQIARSGTFGGF